MPGIKRDMNEAERNEAFEKLENFCQNVGIETYDPIEKMGPYNTCWTFNPFFCLACRVDVVP